MNHAKVKYLKTSTIVQKAMNVVKQPYNVLLYFGIVYDITINGN